MRGLLPTLALGTLMLARIALAAPPPKAELSYRERIQPLLENYCTDCHGPEKQKAKVNLAGPRTASELAAQSDLWYRLLEQVESGKMPPKDEEGPLPEERAALVAWIRGEYTQLVLAHQRAEGRSRLRRFTRTEYANTVEDLFGIRPAVELNLPNDGLVNGYEKVSSALALSSEGARGYVRMAEDLFEWVLQPEGPAEKNGRTVHVPGVDSGESNGQNVVAPDGAIVSFNTENGSGRFDYPGPREPGYHRIRVSAYGFQTDRPLPFGLYVGKTFAYPQEINLARIFEAPPGKPAVFETELYLKKEDGIRLIPFGLGVPVPKNSLGANCKAPGLAVRWLEVDEPPSPSDADRFLIADFPPALVQELRGSRSINLSSDPKQGYRSRTVTPAQFAEILQRSYRRVGARLFRRDLSPEEVAGFTREAVRKMEEPGSTLEDAYFSQIIEMMVSPDFLCVVEQPGRLTDYALASRLSYLLINSTPDEKLLQTAREGRLHQPVVLAAEIDRLLKDPKSYRFISNFGDQWLGLRAIADTSPDGQLYPEYDELLRFSSLRETREFLRDLIESNGSVRQLVAAPYAWLNQPLAEHYGVPGVTGLTLRKVNLPAGSPYGGIWTQSAVLKVTANGTNTSPVKRGVWVSQRLLGIPIPPPPPNIVPLQPDVRGAKTLREQLALHSQDAHCAACHARFDPYGFALESFDVTGGFRTNFRELNPELVSLSPDRRQGKILWRDGLPVDCAGRTPDGHDFKDIAELRNVLAANPRQLAIGFTRHLITYATGTPPTGADEPAINEIVDGAASADYPARTLIHRLIESELFQSK